MLRMVTLARTAQISASQKSKVCRCGQDFAGHIVGAGGAKIDSASFCGEKGGEKHASCCKNVGVGLGGGNGTSKVGAGGRSSGSGEVYDEQGGGEGKRIEEDARKGRKGADSSEDVGGEWWELQERTFLGSRMFLRSCMFLRSRMFHIFAS